MLYSLAYTLERTQKKQQVMETFTYQESVLRLLVSILIDINKDWITENKYISMRHVYSDEKIYSVGQ